VVTEAVVSPGPTIRLTGMSSKPVTLLGERVDVVPRDALARHVAHNALAEAVLL